MSNDDDFERLKSERIEKLRLYGIASANVREASLQCDQAEVHFKISQRKYQEYLIPVEEYENAIWALKNARVYFEFVFEVRQQAAKAYDDACDAETRALHARNQELK